MGEVLIVTTLYMPHVLGKICVPLSFSDFEPLCSGSIIFADDAGKLKTERFFNRICQKLAFIK